MNSENRLQQFCIKQMDAWHCVEYVAILEVDSENNQKIMIRFSNGKTKSIPIPDENKFVNMLREFGIPELNNLMFFSKNPMEDGHEWSLCIVADNQECVAFGVGAFPKAYRQLQSWLDDIPCTVKTEERNISSFEIDELFRSLSRTGNVDAEMILDYMISKGKKSQ